MIQWKNKRITSKKVCKESQSEWVISRRQRLVQSCVHHRFELTIAWAGRRLAVCWGRIAATARSSFLSAGARGSCVLMIRTSELAANLLEGNTHFHFVVVIINTVCIWTPRKTFAISLRTSRLTRRSSRVRSCVRREAISKSFVVSCCCFWSKALERSAFCCFKSFTSVCRRAFSSRSCSSTSLVGAGESAESSSLKSMCRTASNGFDGGASVRGALTTLERMLRRSKSSISMSSDVPASAAKSVTRGRLRADCCTRRRAVFSTFSICFSCMSSNCAFLASCDCL